MRSPLSLLFSRLNNPRALSRSPSALCSRPFPSSVALLWTRSSPSIEGPNTEHSIRGVASPVPSTGAHHCFSPAGHSIPDTSQDTIGLLGHLGTLLAHIQLAVNQHPQVLLCWAAFQPLFPKPVALHGVAVTQVQDPALSFAEPHTTDLSPLIQPVQVPLQSLLTLQQIQLGVICKLTEGALNPLIQIIDEALGNTTCDRPPTGFNSVHHNCLGPAIQPVFYRAKSVSWTDKKRPVLETRCYPSFAPDAQPAQHDVLGEQQSGEALDGTWEQGQLSTAAERRQDSPRLFHSPVLADRQAAQEH
ncbi:hypothetical protein QYF61_013025 [Mycteria americana]|uniref:Uncharacterized protein n=1 Tax=Mycteria americana TaxID=33587 RepID=A0AAN7NCP7_MYCAM|nr:hypothetical protein QYF61_013025 [Mycteria americana]